MKKKDELKAEVAKLSNVGKAIVATEINKIISKYNIKITPDKSLLPKIGDSGHNIYEAIAEFIDNAIDAMTDEQRLGLEQLVITITINVKKNSFSITDNGKGMDRDTLEKAAKLGLSEKEEGKLGSYGIGMKSGLMTLSTAFSISTAVKGNVYRSEFDYDFVEWSKDPDKWELPARDISKNPDEHGTTIKIGNAKVTLTPAKTQHLKSDIAKRYRSFILSKSVKIIVNKTIVGVDEINWTDGYPVNFNVPTKYGEIYGKIGLMKESSQKGYYGFDIFRNGRMIVTNSKFAIGEHATIARIAGEIHLNFIKVSHEKNRFMNDSPEYEAAELACRNSLTFKDILREARKKSEEGDNKKENVIISKYIQENIPLIAQAAKDLEFDVPQHEGKGKAIKKTKKGLIAGFLASLGGGERKPYEKREVPKSDYGDGSRTIGSNGSGDAELRGDVMKINGKTMKVVDEYMFEANFGRKRIEFDEKTGVLSVCINKAFAGFNATKDKTAYCLETIQESIVEYLYKDHQPLINEMNERKESLITRTQLYCDALRKANIEKEITDEEQIISE
jgi:hypothetical protein